MCVHLHVCLRLPATLTLPSSSFHAMIRNQGGHYGPTIPAFCSSSSALQLHLLNRPMSLPLPCSRISPSYQPSKWKVGIRRFRRQESCWQTCMCTCKAVQCWRCCCLEVSQRGFGCRTPRSSLACSWFGGCGVRTGQRRAVWIPAGYLE